MIAVGIKALKAQLSRYVDLARTGTRILITDREEVVAEMVPVQMPGASTNDRLLHSLIREGLVTPAESPNAPMPARPRPRMKLRQLLRQLDEDRADRW